MATSGSFECDQCGACCCTFPIYVSDADAEREPKIRQRGLPLKEWLGDRDWRIQLHPLPFQNGCPFLAENSLCTIYESRPSVCRTFAAGTPQCQEARARKGLLPLNSIK